MATLTEISITARKVIRYGIYLLILIVIARYTIQFAIAIYRHFVPPAKPKPTVSFGKLPKLPFPEKTVPKNISFTLELAEGKLPVILEQTEVYAMPLSQSDIKVEDQARSRASGLGFNPEGKPIVESIPNVYLFQKKGVPSTLTMNIITGVFSVNYDIQKDPKVLTGIPPTPENATALAKSFLSSGSLLQKDIKEGPATTQLLRIEGGKFVNADSLSESQLVKVNLFRKNLGKDANVPSVTPDMPESNIWFIFAGRSKTMIAAEYHYFPINEEKKSTYPLKTSDSAWEELKSGKGYIANVGDNPSGNITIRKIYLAYYDAGQYTEYYQPVVVFEGDNQFYGFIPAVTDEYYGAEKKE